MMLCVMQVTMPSLRTSTLSADGTPRSAAMACAMATAS
jgi:hypothetical protein